MIHIEQLKVGDIIRLRNGRTLSILQKAPSTNLNYPWKLRMQVIGDKPNQESTTYNNHGYFISGMLHDFDIIEIVNYSKRYFL